MKKGKEKLEKTSLLFKKKTMEDLREISEETGIPASEFIRRSVEKSIEEFRRKN